MKPLKCFGWHCWRERNKSKYKVIQNHQHKSSLDFTWKISPRFMLCIYICLKFLNSLHFISFHFIYHHWVINSEHSLQCSQTTLKMKCTHNTHCNTTNCFLFRCLHTLSTFALTFRIPTQSHVAVISFSGFKSISITMVPSSFFSLHGVEFLPDTLHAW